MEKLPCNECGVLILPSTAESTGGICMACKQGIRKDIEASRAFYESQKAYDPYREMWISLVNRSVDDPELKSFSKFEQNYFGVNLLIGDVDNGGFDQYFWNSSGDYYRQAIEGLKEMGAIESLRIVESAAHIMFDGNMPPVDRYDRQTKMKSFETSGDSSDAEPEWSKRINQLDKQFWDDPDKIDDYISCKHGWTWLGRF
jgi:Domain of unknown function (DUF4375)